MEKKPHKYKPIICKHGIEKSLRNEFKKTKVDLKNQNYPGNKTNDFVSKFFKVSRVAILKNLPKDAVLINIPSTGKKKEVNQIITSFAKEINRNKDDVSFISSEGLFIKNSDKEAKKTLSFEKRVKNPITFHFVGESKDLDKLKQSIGKKPVVILEDWASTGESAINFAKTFKNTTGIKPKNICSLISNGIYYPTTNDLNKASDLLANKTGVDVDESKKLIYGNFHDYLGQKLFRFINDLLKSKDKNKMISLCITNIEIYKNFNYTSDDKIIKQINSKNPPNKGNNLEL